MKKTLLNLSQLVLSILCLLSFGGNSSFAQSAIYGGGPIYKFRNYSINELKNSGFTHVVVWTIHIDASGNFNFNGEFPLCTNGAYVGNQTYPDFANDMTALKTGNTSVNRIEFCLSAWGSSTFEHIKNLVNSQGTSSGSILYRNFQAIRNAIPAVDAIGFDDESTYDVSSSTALAVMLGNLGFKVSLVPYTNSAYWTGVANNTNSQKPGTVDRIDLQCYAGGAGNNPCNWNFGSVPVYPGLWDLEKTTSQVQSQLTTWKNNCSSKGGFIWLYDDIDNSPATQQYATAIRNVFGGGEVVNRVATVHKDCNYTGSVIGLPVGSYNLGQLLSRGVLNDDISSIKVTPGYQVEIFADDNFTGASEIITAENSCLVGNSWNDRITSLRVSSTSNTTAVTVYKDCNYVGSSAAFGVGNYTLSQLISKGVLNDDISSIKVSTGFRAQVFADDNFTGASLTITSDNSCLVANGFNDRISSMRVTNITARLGESEATDLSGLKNLVYPIPVGNQLNFHPSVEKGDFRIFNSKGVQVTVGLVEGAIDVSSLPQGLYTIVVSKGKATSKARFIKK